MSNSALDRAGADPGVDPDLGTTDKQRRLVGLARQQQLVALACAVVALALVTVRLRNDSQFTVYAYFSIIGSLLATIDIAAIRLPDWLTLPSYPAILFLEALNGIRSADGAAVIRAVEAALAVLTASMALCIWTSMGLGDLKYAGLVALVLGTRGWAPVLNGLLLAWGFASVWAVSLVCRGRLRSRIPLGPFLTTGALLALLLL